MRPRRTLAFLSAQLEDWPPPLADPRWLALEQGGLNAALYLAARQAGCTAREAEALAVYSESAKAFDAAMKLKVSEQTVKNHLHEVRRKLGVTTTHQAIMKLLS